MIISHRASDDALSPLLLSTIIILCSAFLIALLYFLHSKLLHLFHGGSIPGYSYGGPAASLVNDLGSTASSPHDNQRQLDHHHPVLCIGLNPSVIESIAVSSKYSNRRRRSSEETEDCAVCLGEFEEGDEIRALPKCAHSFHLACIDVWLRCHASCPVCRARLTSGCPGQFHRSGEGS